MRALSLTCLMALLLALAPPLGAGGQPHHVIKVATTAADGSPLVRQLQRLAAIIEERTAGLAVVKLFPDARLGDDTSLATAVQAGAVQIYAADFVALGRLAHEFELLSLPYLFPDYQTADARLDGVVRDKLSVALATRGVRLAAWGPSVYHRWFSRGPPPNTPNELRGLSIFDSAGAAATSHWQALGAATMSAPPNAVSAPERWLLRTTAVAARGTGQADRSTHVTRSNDVLHGHAVVMSRRWFEGLPKRIREALTRLPPDPTTQARKEARALDKALVERMAARGKRLAELAPAARTAFQVAAEQYSATMAAAAGHHAVALLQAIRSP